MTSVPRTLGGHTIPVGVELNELHAHEFGPRVVGERHPVAGALPGIGGHFPGLAQSPRGEDDRPGAEEDELAGRTPVRERAGHPASHHDQPEDRTLHEDVGAFVNGVVLERPDHLQPRPVADMRQPAVGVSPERTLVHASVFRPIEEGAPGLELSHPIRSLRGVRPGHSPVAQPFPASHRVAEMDLPIVFRAVVAECGRHPALGHDGVRLAEQRLADESHGCAGLDGRDRRAEPGAAGSDHEDIMLVAFWNLH